MGVQLLPLLKSRIPAETHGISWLVVFALNHELGAALVKAEDFVGQVEAVGNETEAMRKANTALGVNLQVGVEILVAEWAFQSTGSRIGRSAIFGGSTVLVGVGGNVGLVVAQAHANGKPAAIVGRTDVPGVGSIAHQSRMIGTARKTLAEELV